MPIPIVISTGSPIPVYRQIMDQISAAVVAGRLVEDEALPPVRVLSEQLAVNHNTVARAYSELAREGIIESRSTRGVFVSARRQRYLKSERRRLVEQELNAYVAKALLLGFSAEEIGEQVEEKVEELSSNEAAKPRGGS